MVVPKENILKKDKFNFWCLFWHKWAMVTRSNYTWSQYGTRMDIWDEKHCSRCGEILKEVKIHNL